MLGLKDDFRKAILTHKLKLFHTLANVAIAWWASSIVFCGALVAGVWLKRDDIKNVNVEYLHVFFALMLLFLIAGVLFGILLIAFALVTRSEIEDMFKNLSITPWPSFNAETLVFTVGPIIGALDFVIAIIFWICLWGYFCK